MGAEKGQPGRVIPHRAKYCFSVQSETGTGRNVTRPILQTKRYNFSKINVLCAPKENLRTVGEMYVM
jgi:hypothetical protein